LCGAIQTVILSGEISLTHRYFFALMSGTSICRVFILSKVAVNQMQKTNQNDVQSPWSRFVATFFSLFNYLLIIALIVWGIQVRDFDYYTPEYGLGYWLGIIGGSMMLLLLTYTLRKRIRALRNLIKLKHWFRLHMTLGVLGPVLILFHSNFRLGSLNSTVALVSMLLVAGSGLIGRYLYANIHTNLYGHKIRLAELSKEVTVVLSMIEGEREEVKAIEAQVEQLVRSQAGKSSYIGALKKQRQGRKIVKQIKRTIHTIEKLYKAEHASDSSLVMANHDYKELKSVTHNLIRTFNKIPSMQLFEKLFSLWHVVHIPIFFLMIVTTVTHIYVVHRF